ncbi:MAG: HAMP domain-containing histidine kinase [Actinomycetota bacterium]|nr:HAMP domain-containing histidine kinase [Actinomycetota bacterium]
MIIFALVVASITLVVGLAAVAAIRRLPRLRLQLAGLALLAVLLPLAAVVLSGILMFTSEHDLAILGVAAASSTVALVAALLLARSVTRPLERLRSAASGVARGELGARASEEGPRELAEVAASFNEMAENLEELFDARRQLVAWASHDLRTPLSSLQAMLEALEDGLAEPDRYLPAMREQVQVLGSLVDDLFELARIDSGALTLELREAQLGGLVESCVRGLAAEAEARQIRLAARVDDSVPPVRCSPEKIERVLYNLLTNALRHTPSDGAVAVVVQPARDAVQVTVEDTGDGITPEAARRMFDRFWRGDRARSRDRGGAGLGLAIARGLVEAHGGRIWAESGRAGGARVSFTLPAA